VAIRRRANAEVGFTRSRKHAPAGTHDAENSLSADLTGRFPMDSAPVVGVKWSSPPGTTVADSYGS